MVPSLAPPPGSPVGVRNWLRTGFPPAFTGLERWESRRSLSFSPWRVVTRQAATRVVSLVADAGP